MTINERKNQEKIKQLEREVRALTTKVDELTKLINAKKRKPKEEKTEEKK